MSKQKSAKGRKNTKQTQIQVSPAMSLFFIALFISIPFLNPYHTNPLPNFYTEWLSITFAMLAMSLMIQRGLWQGDLWIPRIAILPLLLTVVLMAQAMLGHLAYTETAWQVTLYMMWVTGLIWLGGALKKHVGLEVVLLWLSWAALVGGILSVLIGVTQFFGVQEAFGGLIAVRNGGAVYGNLGQANHFANYLVVALVGLGYLHVKQRVSRIWAVVFGALLLLGMVLSGSRSTLVYLFLLIVVAHSIYWRSNDQAGRVLLRVVWITVPLLLIIQLAISGLPQLLTQLVVTTGGVDPAVAVAPIVTSNTVGDRLTNLGALPVARLFLWQHAWHMFMDEPLLGVGWGEFIGQFFQRFSDLPNPGVPTIDPNAHNFILHLLATTGLIGTLVVLVPLGLWMRRAQTIPVSVEKWWLVCILAVQAIHGLMEYNLWYAQFLGIVALLLGLGETSEFRFRGDIWKRTGWVWLAILLISFVLLAGMMRDYRTMEAWIYGRQDALANMSRLEADLQDVQRNSLFRPYAELMHPALVMADSAISAEKLKLSGRMMRFAPNSRVAYRHAILLASNGEQTAAKEQLERSIAVYPRELTIFVQQYKGLAVSNPDKFGELIRIGQERLSD